MICNGTIRCLSVQTELTTKEVTTLEVNNQKKQEEFIALSNSYISN